MLCENCNKKNATSIFLSKQSGKVTYLCGECYLNYKSENELDNLILEQSAKLKIDAVCKNCGTSINEFLSSKFFGCEYCYFAFEEYLRDNFLSKFKNTDYLGKKPNAYYVAKQIKELEQMVEICIKNGNIKQATKYGEEIQKLKEQNYDKL